MAEESGNKMVKTAQQKPEEGELKIVVVGDGAVGKTCLVASYISDEFPEHYIPTVFDAHKGTIAFRNEQKTLIIWDTAGQEDLNKLRVMAYPHTSCFLVCFNLTDKKSLESACTTWKDELVRLGPKNTPMILVGTK